VLPSAVEKLQTEVNSAVKDILANYHPRPIRAKKVIRDTAFGFNAYYPHEINLLDSPLLQRLRGIRQTSLACYTYPSAVHTRFEHSLGATVMVDRMIEALKIREPSRVSDPAACAEARMAALLHDVGHGPFSHGTEIIFQSFEEIQNVKKENPQLFKEAAAHEILSYFIVNSESFSKKWDEIKVHYLSILDYKPCNLAGIDPKRVALIILGKHPNQEMRFLAQMVNGPHDADKFDYVTRDGYFTGLRTAIDIDRFLLSLGTHRDNETNSCSLCVDLSGVTALEQLLFNKMQLFSSVYHHQNVRAAVQALISAFNIYKEKKLTSCRGLTFDSVVDFIKVDEFDLLGSVHDNEEFKNAIEDLRNRTLPMRALVLCSDSVEDDKSRFWLSRMRRDSSKIQELRTDIATKAEQRIGDVFIDFPEAPRFDGTAFGSLVKTSPEDVVRLNEIFPVGGWAKGHATHRYRVYIFSRLGSEGVVAKAAYEVLKRDEYKIKVNKMAFFLANHTLEFIASLGLSK